MPEHETVAIIGVGLIGGSIGLALRRRSSNVRVVGIGRDSQRLSQAVELGAATEVTTDLAAGVAKADIIVVCTPVGRIVKFVRDSAKHCPSHAVITDAGSTKQQIVEQLPELRYGTGESGQENGQENGIGDDHHSGHTTGPVFIGSHPLAGSEKTGVQAARENLFDNRLVVVTPSDSTRPDDANRLCEFWRSLGARVHSMTPAEHDSALAATSHVPHVVASALAAATPAEHLPLSAGGWRDTTRVAGGDPELWRQILASNPDHVLKSLDEFAKKLASFRRALVDDDQDALRQLLQAGKTRRDALGS